MNLAALADKINALHAGAVPGADPEHARHLGLLLLTVKEQLPPRTWHGWLASHLSFTPRSAQRFIRLALLWDQDDPDEPAPSEVPYFAERIRRASAAKTRGIPVALALAD